MDTLELDLAVAEELYGAEDGDAAPARAGHPRHLVVVVLPLEPGQGQAQGPRLVAAGGVLQSRFSRMSEHSSEDS